MATTYRFGHVEVRPAERQLLVEGRPTAVGARAFDLLLALIDHRDRVVSKDELMDLVWPGVVVEENNLQVQVSALRKLMGAGAVATVPGRGYRFTLAPEASAAPARPLSPMHNLPARLDAFIGREAEIAEVASLLERSRLVTLTSVGGTGKTRLSLEVASRLFPSYREGAWWVELAPLADERLVPQAVATALGVREEAGRPIEEALERHVAARSLLVILDNCEHLLEPAARACRLLLAAGPGVRILASSREPLRVAGESAYPIPALDGPHAMELFVDRARAASPSFAPGPSETATMQEICRRLDGIPLAIELAAARVRVLSVETISERLDDCFRLLTDGDPTALPRQKTMRASIDWSHDLLPAPERILLRRLAVFAGSFTLEAAEAICAGGEVERSESALELLTHLVEKSLVARDAGGRRYRLLEVMRQYARERLEESAEMPAIRDRHLAHYLRFAERAGEEIIGPDQAAWMARLDAERENVLAAHAWCDRAGDGRELGLRLVTSIRQYWLSRGLLSLAYGFMVQALERAPERSALRCRALFDAGQLGYFMGMYRDARRHLEEALDIARQAGDEPRIASVLQLLGMACLGLGAMADARACLEDALVRARAGGEPRTVTAAVNALAQLHRVQGRLEQAEPLYEHVLDLARTAGDRESVAIALLNLAMTAVDRKSAERARAFLAEALRIAEEIDSRSLAQCGLDTATGLAALEGDWDRAARLHGAAESLAARTGLSRDPADAAFLSPWLDQVRGALGSPGFDAAKSSGAAEPLPRALERAQGGLAAPMAS